MFSEKITEKIIYLIIIICVIYVVKPSVLFKANGKLRNYGVGVDSEGYKKTLYSFHLVIILIAIFLVYIL